MTHSTKAPVHHLPGIVRALKAMAHPVRLRMLAMLATGELCVCQLTAVLDLAASTVSGHLADLRAAGLVHERKEGKWVHYRLTDDPELSAVIRSALASLARDHQTDTDAAAVRRVRRLPVETVSGGGFDLAAATARGRLCCAASPSPAARKSRPRMAAV
jgi:DNA-binding transcriptional ArsR family regulator